MKKIISILSKDDIKIIKVSFGVGIILSLILTIPYLFIDWWKIGFGLSVLLGNIASIITYYKLVVITTKVTNFEYQNPRKVFIFNNLSSLLIYFVILLFCTLIKIFSIFTCALGIFIIKAVIIILFGIKKEKK